jgi:hypothetical protein
MVVGADTVRSAVWRPVETVAWLRMPSCVPVGRVDVKARERIEEIGTLTFWFIQRSAF